jgi:hypothetical protein
MFQTQIRLITPAAHAAFQKAQKVEGVIKGIFAPGLGILMGQDLKGMHVNILCKL